MPRVRRFVPGSVPGSLDLAVVPLVLAVYALLLPHKDVGVLALGVVTGALYALNAVGVILVYRSNRIVNFAQLAVGAVGATVFVAVVTYDPVLRSVRNVCGTCLFPVPGWWYPALFVFAALVGVAIATLLSYLLYVVVIRLLDDAPRLVVTVATLFFVSIAAELVERLGRVDLWASRAQIDARIPLQPPKAPFSASLKVGLVTLRAPDLLVLATVVVLVPALTWYLLKSSTGIAMRAAAENPGRVASLGVNVRSVTGRVWLIAGLVSGLSAALSAMGGAIPAAGAALNPQLIVRVLLIVVVARFTSLPIAAAAAISLGILQQSVLFAYGTPVGLDGALLVVLGAVLLLQRARGERADVESASRLRATREIRPIPAELRNLPEVRKWLRAAAFTVAVFVFGAPLVLSPSQTNLATYVLIVTMVFLSLLVLTGWAGQISLGQLAFAGTGAWAAAVTGWPLPIALLAGAVAGGALAAVAGIPGLKLKGLHLAIVTLALNLSVSSYLLNERYLGKHLPDAITRPNLAGMDLDNEQVFYYFCLAVLALVTLMVAGLRRSTYARALIASRDNEAAAQAFGVNLFRARLSAFAISGAVAGFAGALVAYQQHTVIPETFAATESLTVFLFSALGGLGAVSAPLVAGGLYALAKLFLSTAYVRLLTGGLGIVLLLFTTGGVSELLYNLRDNLLRGVARRRKIVVPSLLADEAQTETRLPIKPNRHGRGGTVFVPARYRLDDQYAIRPPVEATGDAT